MALQLPDYRLINDVQVNPLDVAGSIQRGASARQSMLQNKTTWGKIADQEKARQIIQKNTNADGIDYDSAVRELTSAGLQDYADPLFNQKVAVTKDRLSTERGTALEAFRQAVLAGAPIEEINTLATEAGVSPPAATPAVAPAAPAIVAPASPSEYIVKPDDTLSEIANKLNIKKWEDIAAANNIPEGKEKSIQPGQKLIIPGQTVAAPAAHVIKAGERLADIAQQNGTTVAELQKANNLDSNVTPVAGQQLIIPSSFERNVDTKQIKRDLEKEILDERKNRYEYDWKVNNPEEMRTRGQIQSYTAADIGKPSVQNISVPRAEWRYMGPEVVDQTMGNLIESMKAQAIAPQAADEQVAPEQAASADKPIDTSSTFVDTSAKKGTRPLTAQEIAHLYLKTVPLDKEASLNDILNLLDDKTTGKQSAYAEKSAELKIGFEAAFGDPEGQELWNKYQTLLTSGNVTQDKMRDMQYKLNAKNSSSYAAPNQKEEVFELIKKAATVPQPSMIEFLTQLETGTTTTAVMKYHLERIDRKENEIEKIQSDYDTANLAQSIITSNLPEDLSIGNLNAALTAYSRQLSNEALSDQEFIRKMSAVLPGWIGIVKGAGMKITGTVPKSARAEMLKVASDLKKGIDEYYQDKLNKKTEELNSLKGNFSNSYRGKNFRPSSGAGGASETSLQSRLKALREKKANDAKKGGNPQ